MKKEALLSLIIIFILSTSSIKARDTTSLSGKYALQFQIAKNFSLSSFMGGIISGSYHFSELSALRIGFSGTGTRRNSTFATVDPDGEPDSWDYKTWSCNYEITTQYVFTPWINNCSLFYWGFGPTVAYSENGEAGPPSRVSYTHSTGVSLCAGAEWFITKSVSLLGEYNVAYRYDISKTNSFDGINSTTEKNYQYSFSPGSVRFGLSVYF